MPEPLGGWNDYQSERTAFVPWVTLVSSGTAQAATLWDSFSSGTLPYGLRHPNLPTVVLVHQDSCGHAVGEVRFAPGCVAGHDLEYEFQVEPELALIRCDVSSPRFWDTLNHALSSCGLAWSLLSGGLLIHSSSVRQGQGVHLFAGPSGIGKTTLATWAASKGAHLRSVDQTLVKPDGCGGWLAVSADSGERVAEPLQRIVVIDRGARTVRRQLSPAAGLRALLPNIILWPHSNDLHALILERAFQLVTQTQVAHLDVDLGSLEMDEVFGG